MKEENQCLFMDLSGLGKSPGIEERANAEYIRIKLEERFPEDIFKDIQVRINRTGKYQAKAGVLEKIFGAGKPIEDLPEYVEVRLLHSTGAEEESLIVWSPTAWNDRFAGTCGGGTGIGGDGYLTKPKNTQRGWTVPYAVMNGFTAATMNAGNIEGFHDKIMDKETGRFSKEYYENWRVRSTHNMTIFGKAIAEILHERPIRYSYLNGGSGGGRQSLMEVQNYPEDYDGVWASCPAINWHKFLLGGFWPVVVMNEHHHFLNAEKNLFFQKKARDNAGGDDAFYSLREPPAFDAASCIGMESKGGRITEKDAAVMNDIWSGPHRKNGEFLWYGFYPGVQNWRKIIPIGTYYYPLFGFHRVQEFILGTYHGRWITEDAQRNFRKITLAEFEQLYDQGLEKFSDSLGDDPALEDFAGRGGKLLIDHGTDDPLIPTEGTLDYYRKLLDHFETQESVDSFCRLYITPGDNHGNCWGNGPGISESTGMKALIDWCEKEEQPEELPTIRVEQKTGRILKRGSVMPWRGRTHEG